MSALLEASVAVVFCLLNPQGLVLTTETGAVLGWGEAHHTFDPTWASSRLQAAGNWHPLPLEDARGSVLWLSPPPPPDAPLEQIRALMQHTLAALSDRALLEGILRVSPQAIYLKDHQGLIQRSSVSTEALFGLQAAQVRVREGQTLPTEAWSLGGWRDNDLLVLRSGETLSVEESLPVPDGSRRHFATVKTPLEGWDGSRALLGVSSDISPTYALETRLGVALRLLEGSPEGQLIFGIRGELLFQNPAAQQLLGYAPDDWREVVPMGRLAPSLALEIEQALQAGESWSGDGIVQDAADAPHHLSLHVAPLRDATGRLRAVGVRLAPLTSAHHAYVSLVSHELRTPLTSIGASLGLLEHLLSTPMPEVQELLEIAGRNVDRLSRLVSDLLDLARLEEGGLSFEFVPLELYPLLEHTLEDLRPVATRAGVKLSLFGEEHLLEGRLDPSRLGQVLTNLLSNAIKVSCPGQEVELALLERPGLACIEVRDRGPGVPEPWKARIFERFVQLPQTPQGIGSGLGLPITQALVVRLGGRLSLFDREGGGTVFCVELPLLEPPPED